MITSFMYKAFIFIILFCVLQLYFQLLIIVESDRYIEFLDKNRKHKWLFKRMNREAREMVNDAKELIKSVDESIEINEFNVYNVRFTKSMAWFNYDIETGELNVFMPFKSFIRKNIDYCFMVLLHEILHFQNKKGNECIFEDSCLEGMNELFTLWLIENYSKKYKVSKTYTQTVLLWLIKRRPFNVYEKETNMVKSFFEKANIDMKSGFLNYIDINADFFREFIPEEYFL